MCVGTHVVPLLMCGGTHVVPLLMCATGVAAIRFYNSYLDDAENLKVTENSTSSATIVSLILVQLISTRIRMSGLFIPTYY